MDFPLGRPEATAQLDYQTLSRGGAIAYGNVRLASYEASEHGGSEFSIDPTTGNVMQRSASFCVSQPGMYPQQHQLQQQQRQQQQYGPVPQDVYNGGGEQDADRRESLQHSHLDYDSSLAQQQMPSHDSDAQQALRHQRSFQQLRIGQPSSSRPHQVSLRQQVLTPTFAQHGQFGGPGPMGRMPALPHGSDSATGGGIVMSRSSSLPALYGQHQPGLDFHSPALSLDTAATFTGPPASVFEGYSRPPSTASTSFYSTGGAMHHLGGFAPGSEHMQQHPDAATAAANQVPVSASDMSYDMSARSFDCSMSSNASTAMTSLPSSNTTLCDMSSQPKFSPTESFGMVLPHGHNHGHNAGYDHHSIQHARFAVPSELYANRAQVTEVIGPFGPTGALSHTGFSMSGPPDGNALGLMAHPGLGVKLEDTERTEGDGSTQAGGSKRKRPSKAARDAAPASAAGTGNPNHRPTIPPSESNNYSIDALLAITRAAEADPSIFPCPFCDKSYEGKHARSIWRRHLQDKHAIPLSAQPRRTRWDSDVNRPKNAEERRQRMLESKRRWAQKRRKQKHLEAEAKAAAAAAAAAVAEAEKSNMADSVIEQMRAWYEHAKAQVIDVTTDGGWNYLGALEEVGGEGDGDHHDDDDSDLGDDEDGYGMSQSAAAADQAAQPGSSKTAVTPGRPTLAEASGISPNSPFALPAWLDQQPPSLRAAALAAIQAQRAQARSRRKGAGEESASRSASRRKSGGMLGMARTMSLPAPGSGSGNGNDNGSGPAYPDRDGMKRTYSQQAGPSAHGDASLTSWDPFVVPPVPGRSGSLGDQSNASLHPISALHQNGAAAQTKLPSPILGMMSMPEPGAQPSHDSMRNRTSPYHHVGGVDHSPTPAGRRAAAALGHSGLPPMMSSSSLASSPVGAATIRPPVRNLVGDVQSSALALRQSVLTNSHASAEDIRSAVSSSPTSLGAAIALGTRPVSSSTTLEPAAAAAVSAGSNGQENPFSLDKHKISPSQPPRSAGSRRQTTLPESPRPLLFDRTGTAPSNESGTNTGLAPSPSFAMGRHLPPLPGLNERSLGGGEDPMMLAGSVSARRNEDVLELGLEMDTPMRLFANAFSKAELALPSASTMATPRSSRNGRQREMSALSASLLGLGTGTGGTTSASASLGVGSGSLAPGLMPAPSSSSSSSSNKPSSGMAGAVPPLATPDRYTRPRGLSSVLRNLGGTPSAGLRFNLNESPHSALMSMSMTVGMGQALAMGPGGNLSAGVVIGNPPLSTSKSWGALSSAMLDWPTAGGVELSPIRAKVPLMERKDGSNTLPPPLPHGGAPLSSTPFMMRSASGLSVDGIGKMPASPTSAAGSNGGGPGGNKSRSGSDSGALSPLLRPSTSTSSTTSGLSALGAALTRPRGLSKGTMSSSGSWLMGGNTSAVRTESGTAASAPAPLSMLPHPASASAPASISASSTQASGKRGWDSENGPGAANVGGAADWKRVRA
ncbi:hypothetical protein OC842_001226 [Tilletia horrida]|uniref:Uncharacterized protein n=1 Tax=Tilletia horrida TaxID=155126 RepID=A0AAN6GHZ9_9BASI|nr:hypothetical protein OC842_001226 [Tilletia horrida]